MSDGTKCAMCATPACGRCKQCHGAAYCSVDCQRRHWIQGHGAVCAPLAQPAADGSDGVPIDARRLRIEAQRPESIGGFDVAGDEARYSVRTWVSTAVQSSGDARSAQGFTPLGGGDDDAASQALRVEDGTVWRVFLDVHVADAPADQWAEAHEEAAVFLDRDTRRAQHQVVLGALAVNWTEPGLVTAVAIRVPAGAELRAALVSTYVLEPSRFWLNVTANGDAVHGGHMLPIYEDLPTEGYKVGWASRTLPRYLRGKRIVVTPYVAYNRPDGNVLWLELPKFFDTATTWPLRTTWNFTVEGVLTDQITYEVFGDEATRIRVFVPSLVIATLTQRQARARGDDIAYRRRAVTVVRDEPALTPTPTAPPPAAVTPDPDTDPANPGLPGSPPPLRPLRVVPLPPPGGTMRIEPGRWVLRP